MEFRYYLGRVPSALHAWLLSRRWFPLFRRFRGGRDWTYDACRFAGTRDFVTVFDVGANRGTVSLSLARFFPEAAIHAFEPVAATYAGLRRACSARPRIFAHQLALADAPGEVLMETQACSELNSLRFDAPAAASLSMERVAVTTLSAFCTREKIAAIDLLKVDAQGFDLAVIRGGESLLRAGLVPFIVAEGGLQPDDTTNQPFLPLNAYLVAEGYRLAGIYEQLNYGPRLRYLGCFNALYLHPAALEARFPLARPPQS